MQQTTTYTIGPVTAGNSATFTLQFDTPFPDTDYATGISLGSNSLTPSQIAAGIRGLQLASMTKRPDGIDMTLTNPDSTDHTDTAVVWSSNDQ